MMQFLPIVSRELRVAARRRSTYWSRLGLALAAIAIGGWIMLMPFMSQPQRLGMALFISLSCLTFIYCLLAGIRTTTDCLSEEKREGTLGLLFLTDLKGYDIVLGKLAATSVNAFYAMLAVFPVMAISLLLGGVTGSEFWRVVLVCVNNLFFSLAVGMFCSAISREERKAVFGALGILLVLTVGLPLIGLWITAENRLSHPPAVTLVLSPGYASFMAFEEPFRTFRRYNYFYHSVVAVQIMSWILLFSASLIVPRTWKDKASSLRAQAWQARRDRFRFGSEGERKLFRLRVLAMNPLHWLTGRNRLKGFFPWGFLGLLGLIWLWGVMTYPRDWLDESTYVLTALLVHTAFKVWVAMEGCRWLVEDRRSGALELLLATPLKVREMLKGQWLSLVRQFGGPVAVVLAVDWVFLLSRSHDGDWMWLWTAGLVVFLADLYAIGWVSMWMGLNSRNTTRAGLATVVRVLIVPWVAWALLFTLLGILDYTFHFAWQWMGDRFPLFAWLVLSLLADAGFSAWARQRLRQDFRLVASERFGSRLFGLKAWILPPAQPPKIT